MRVFVTRCFYAASCIIGTSSGNFFAAEPAIFATIRCY